ncbi:hypothetical protein [Paenibacillus sp. HB172176]|uniref:hypothetical protein n=1 Tax=Paenibacillus sp. HB172176 TaxID=2493690 RepID=UPI00143B3E15|nr:hypothetical protein [Paenibacillus sp. HB172176]
MTKQLRAHDSNFSKLLYSQLVGDEIISFYRTKRNKLGIGWFVDKEDGIKLIQTSGYDSIYSEDALTWHGKEDNMFSMLYGTVQDSLITQVIAVSEGYKAATIVESNGIRIWYVKQGARLHLPITIRATDRNGDIIFETGDFEHWESD